LSTVSSADLNGIWGTGTGELWAVGNYGSILARRR
jgi:hypothetical protein